jgi:hypothetical protein
LWFQADKHLDEMAPKFIRVKKIEKSWIVERLETKNTFGNEWQRNINWVMIHMILLPFLGKFFCGIDSFVKLNHNMSS